MGRWANKYVIGLTGNIAMGKSAVRKMLESLGAYTIDADGLAHLVMAPGAPAYQPVVDWFGKWLLNKEGKIDRTKLGAVAFAHPEALARLESLTHPVIMQGIDTLIRRAQQPIAVIEAIKLVDGPLGGMVDTVWVVDSATQVQFERLVKRGLTETEARQRIALQNPQRDKLARADVTISNNGSLQDAWVQVEREWKKLLTARGLQEQQSDEVSVSVVQVTQQPVKVPTAPLPAASPPLPPSEQSAPPTPIIRPITATGQLNVANVPAALNRPATASAPAVEVAAPPPQPEAAPTPATESSTLISIKIRRGMPHTADDIARLLNQGTGKALNRMDIITRFGEKSYLLAEVDSKIVGLAGFHVDNLIARMDELVVDEDMPQTALANALLEEVEKASKALQSEIGLMFLPTTAQPTLLDVFTKAGYQKMDVESIKNPAWREAAEESQPPNTFVFAKKLGERVLKPL